MIEVIVFFVIALAIVVSITRLPTCVDAEEIPETHTGLALQSFEYYRALQMERISKLLMKGDRSRTHLDCNNPDSYFFQHPTKLDFDVNLNNFRTIWGKYEQNLIDSYKLLLKNVGKVDLKVEYIKGGGYASLVRTLHTENDVEHYMKFGLPFELQLFELNFVSRKHTPDNINILRIVGVHEPLSYNVLTIV